MLKIKLLDEISKSGKQILDRIFHLISQPIRNSLWKMTPNLVLAPLLMTLILFSYALFHEVSYGISPFSRVYFRHFSSVFSST